MTDRKFAGTLPALLALVLLLVTALPALAYPPERSEYPIEDAFTLAECDGFDVIDEFAGTVYQTRFYNGDGNLTSYKNRVRVRDRIYNSVTGYEVWSVWHNTTFHETDGSYTIAGVGWNVTVPGAGAVWFDAGHCEYDPDVGYQVCTGHAEYDEDVICAAMDRDS